MRGSLTPKQAAYVEARASGLGPLASYKLAYNPPTMSLKAMSVEAAALEHHPSVSAALALALPLAIARVAERAAERSLPTREAALQRAWEVAQSNARDRGQHLALTFDALGMRSASVQVDQSQHVHIEATVEEIRAALREARGEQE